MAKNGKENSQTHCIIALNGPPTSLKMQNAESCLLPNTHGMDPHACCPCHSSCNIPLLLGKLTLLVSIGGKMHVGGS